MCTMIWTKTHVLQCTTSCNVYLRFLRWSLIWNCLVSFCTVVLRVDRVLLLSLRYLSVWVYFLRYQTSELCSFPWLVRRWYWENLMPLFSFSFLVPSCYCYMQDICDYLKVFMLVYWNALIDTPCSLLYDIIAGTFALRSWFLLVAWFRSLWLMMSFWFWRS